VVASGVALLLRFKTVVLYSEIPSLTSKVEVDVVAVVVLLILVTVILSGRPLTSRVEVDVVEVDVVLTCGSNKDIGAQVSFNEDHITMYSEESGTNTHIDIVPSDDN